MTSDDFNIVLEKEKNTALPKLADINVAVVMDSFSYNSYKMEFNAFCLEPDSWLDVFEENEIDLFFCESAWHGVGKSNIINNVAVENIDSPWEHKITYINRDKEKTLLKIIEYCNENDIPTVFWNKEDPKSFDIFVDAALNFDYIFTSDYDSVKKYLVRGHENVHPLLFASQIKHFNPIQNKERSKDIIFAGSWYGYDFPQRCALMKEMFNKIIESGYNLKIYDRYSKISDKNPSWKYPDEYDEYINPSVSFDNMDEVYKESKYSLNINSITNSPTMFARRVFELMSSNTYVISNYSRGVYDLFGNNVYYLDKEESLDLNQQEVERVCEENLYNVLKNHNYTQRFKYILNVIGFEYDESVENVYVIYTDDSYDAIKQDFDKISYNHKKCLMITSNPDLTKDEKDEKIQIINQDDLMNLADSFDEDDYFIIRDLKKDINQKFVDKAVLHYKYLNKDYLIEENANKYILNTTTKYENRLFSNNNFKRIIFSMLNDKKEEYTVYSI